MAEFAILLHEKNVGKAEVFQQGLYYRIACRLNLSRDAIYRVSAFDGNKKQDLGVCVPEKDCFCLNKRIPIKQLTLCDDLKFYVENNKDKPQKHSYPVSSDKPFVELSNLMNAYFEMQEGTGYIIFR